MATEDEHRAAAAGAAGAQNEDTGMSADDDLRPPQPTTAAGLNLGNGQGSAEAMTIQQLMVYLTHQNQVMTNMMAMLQHDRPEVKAEKNHLANVKLDERNFRSVSKFNNLRSGWREWKRQFMAAVRECDVDFADFTWAFEQREEPVDHILEFNPTQAQLAVNLHNRLIAATTGTAFQIVESVGH